MNTEELIKIIEDAFEGVVLGDGISVEQTIVIDNYGEGFTDEEFEALKTLENTEDWKSLDAETLNKLEIAHIDAEGFRFYIPALMVNFFKYYDDFINNNFVNATIFSLLPKNSTGNFSERFYNKLNIKQKYAISQFLYWLPNLLELDSVDIRDVHEAYENYWKDYL